MANIERLAVASIRPGTNDRTVFDKQALQGLAANIAANGLIQPITVRPVEQGFEIVAGERRYRACKDLLGWSEIPAVVMELGDQEASAVMLAENVARENLDPIDEGRAYASRMERFGLTVAEVADQAGVTSVRVRFRLKLLALRPDVQRMVRTNNLSIGYAQILADGDLDANRQMLAVRALRDNPRATPSWFRRIVNALVEEQQQGILFEMPLFGGPNLETSEQHEPILPPTPTTAKPPKCGRTVHETLAGQASFWDQAAESWDALGKPFKRQECQAASQALQAALGALGGEA